MAPANLAADQQRDCCWRVLVACCLYIKLVLTTHAVNQCLTMKIIPSEPRTGDLYYLSALHDVALSGQVDGYLICTGMV